MELGANEAESVRTKATELMLLSWQPVADAVRLVVAGGVDVVVVDSVDSSVDEGVDVVGDDDGSVVSVGVVLGVSEIVGEDELDVGDDEVVSAGPEVEVEDSLLDDVSVGWVEGVPVGDDDDAVAEVLVELEVGHASPDSKVQLTTNEPSPPEL